jgi:hypothetical protein
MFDVTDIKKNLVIDSLLSKNWFKMIFRSDKFIITNKCMFVKKEYSYENLFKTNVIVIEIIDENSNKNTSSSYLFEFYDIWYDMLEYVNCNSIQRLINLEFLEKSY